MFPHYGHLIGCTNSTMSRSPDSDQTVIRFSAIDRWYYENCPHPIPAVTRPPEWLRTSPVYGSEGRGSAPTLKRCTPTRDFALSGYLILLPVTVSFARIREGRLFVTSHPRHVLSPVGKFPGEQLADFPTPCGYDGSQALKWINPWVISTPPGYSVLIQHPDGLGLDAFRTFSAIVDSDIWGCPTNLAFLLQEGFEGDLPAGTPIARVTPFRRESWESEVGLADQEELFVKDQQFKTSWEQGYDRNFRQPKRYT